MSQGLLQLDPVQRSLEKNEHVGGIDVDSLGLLFFFLIAMVDYGIINLNIKIEFNGIYDMELFYYMDCMDRISMLDSQYLLNGLRHVDCY